MESGSKKWGFQVKQGMKGASTPTVRGVLYMLMDSLNKEDSRAVIPLAHGDPSHFPSFTTAAVAEDAVINSLRSAKYNCYAPTIGLPAARRAVAEYLNHDLPYKLSPDDVYLTSGCHQAIETALAVLGRPGANILLPRPGYPYYEACASYNGLEIRHFDLLPDKGWAVDLNDIEALADDNTVAMVIINPGNPCGNVFSYEHLKKFAETARDLGILVIGDEAYDKLAFGSTPYVPMRVFGSTVPILTLGSISKRWIVPGWRIGWLVTNDPNGILRNSGIIESITKILEISSDPTTFVQAAIPEILENTKEDFFSKIICLLREAADICYTRVNEIPCITCPKKPEGSMAVMVKLNPSMLEDIDDDMEFCVKLAKEESVLILPGVVLGLKNWLRITFAVEPSCLEEGLARIKAFCQRHAKKH
ncbi:Aminotransferase, class I/classII [Corchorus olitorius]|uniref:Aminotransferase, class I/classII n=1 Tax=Corchorus olitorius TaxID=93759 RepID=A0A1R3JAM7_9ROSI|nr:Aminotransferase, class I/classII [Corchorus olitorius]